MSEIRPESLDYAERIQSSYGPHFSRLAIRGRDGLRAAIAAGQVVPLVPVAGHRIQPRLDGAHPIGELDLPHQDLYLSARPEALGCLLEIASRVRSGPVEVTSLVRHDAYQRRLAVGNANARTAVPTHVMGLAFDISILNTPIETAAEIRDVLSEMAADGDLLFVAERRQLVFHVVPAPARREYYAGLYQALVLAPPPVIPVPRSPLIPSRAELHAELDHLLASGVLQAGALQPGAAPLGELLLLLGGAGLAWCTRRVVRRNAARRLE